MSFTVMNYKVCKHVSFCSNSEEKAIFWGAFCALAVSLVLNGGLLLVIVTRGRPLSPLHIFTIRYATYIPTAGVRQPHILLGLGLHKILHGI